MGSGKTSTAYGQKVAVQVYCQRRRNAGTW